MPRTRIHSCLLQAVLLTTMYRAAPEFRVDSALYHGYDVPHYYDNLISKLIIHGKSRNECLMRLRRALEEYVIEGIDTNISLHQRLVSSADFISAEYHIHWLERFIGGSGAIGGAHRPCHRLNWLEGRQWAS